MIGVTNDEMVFYGLMEKTTVKKARIYNRTKKEKKNRLIISFFFRSTRKYWREEDIRLSFPLLPHPFKSFPLSIEYLKYGNCDTNQRRINNTC